MKALDARHEEKYQVYHGLKEPTPTFLSSLREEMMKMMNKKRKMEATKEEEKEEVMEVEEEEKEKKESEEKEKELEVKKKESVEKEKESESSSPIVSDSEESETPHLVETPWTMAEKHKKNYDLLQQRRRVVIPFQTSPSEISHKYFPPTEYLQYRFVIDLPSQESLSPQNEAIGEAEKPQIVRYHFQQGSEIHIKGYVVWREKKRRRETTQEKEKKLPLALRNKVWEVG